MGFQHVVEYHGGILEQGKDFVMWKPGPDGRRENWAVVVKAGRVTGAAAGKGSAAEVCFQIQQAAQATYLDPVSAKQTTIDRIYVVSNDRISKEAILSIGSALPPAIQAKLEGFYGLDRLWEWLQQFSPRKAAVDTLSRVSRELQHGSELFDVSTTLVDGKVQLSVKPRAGANPDAARIGGTIEFSATHEHSAQNLASLQQHLATGAPVRIEQARVSLNLPDELSELVGPVTGQLATVNLARRALVSLPVHETDRN
jgi:hypothetical protein